MTLFDEKYYHRFCVRNEITNDSCGKHTGCHEAFVHGICVSCNVEKFFTREGEPFDKLRVTKDEYEAIKLDRII